MEARTGGTALETLLAEFREAGYRIQEHQRQISAEARTRAQVVRRVVAENGNVTAAASSLGVSRQTIYRLLEDEEEPAVSVAWEKIGPQQYEDAVAVLLSTIFDAERIDGAGGDGGRDVQVRRGNRLDCYELKSFTGRLRGGRRSQVERSLARAAILQPSNWTLVVPIDHTPKELEWFDRLRSQYPFSLHWYGLTWLNRQLSQHPAIVRYYFESGEGEAIRLLRELREEVAALDGGIPQAVDRASVLRERMNELSPHYAFDLSISDEKIGVGFRPKYSGSERDSPITISGEMAFPDTPAGKDAAARWREVMEWGGHVTVDPEYVRKLNIEGPAGLGGEYSGVSLSIGPARPEGAAPLDGLLTVVDKNGRRLGTLTVRLSDRQQGERGITLTGRDVTGMVQIQLRFDRYKGTVGMTLRYDPPGEVLPASLLASLRLMAQMCSPNRVALTVDGQSFGDAMALTEPAMVPSSFVKLVEDLAIIQTHSCTPFNLPSVLTSEDLFAIKLGARLVRGETVRISQLSISMTATPTAPEAMRKFIMTTEPVALANDVQDYSVTVGEHSIDLGPAVVSVPVARLGNRDALIAEQAWEKDEIELQVVPDTDIEVYLKAG